jgi:hypothetical protein
LATNTLEAQASKGCAMSIDSIAGTETNRTAEPQKDTRKHFSENFSKTVVVKNEFSQHAIHIRKLKIASKWTEQQRADRRRNGIVNRAWFLKIVGQVKNS